VWLYSKGLLVLIGIHQTDTPEKTSSLVHKLVHLRIFNDSEDKMNLNVQDVGGQILVISQFTLYGNCLSGRRPDFIQAAPPALALPIYHKFVEEVRQTMGSVQTGQFGAEMQVALINDGPATFIIEV
jgi:D-tyrosyl-tRNA(Tyr) deacylase